jgi:hypothetical protein
MKRLIAFFTVAFAGAVSMAPASAADAPFLPAQIAGLEIRGNMHGTYVFREDHVWRFYAGGRVTGALYGRDTGSRISPPVDDTDTGTWSVKGGQLCVSWTKWYRGRETCYSATRVKGIWHSFSARGEAGSFQGSIGRY